MGCVGLYWEEVDRQRGEKKEGKEKRQIDLTGEKTRQLFVQNGKPSVRPRSVQSPWSHYIWWRQDADTKILRIVRYRTRQTEQDRTGRPIYSSSGADVQAAGLVHPLHSKAELALCSYSSHFRAPQGDIQHNLLRVHRFVHSFLPTIILLKLISFFDLYIHQNVTLIRSPLSAHVLMHSSHSESNLSINICDGDSSI